MSPAPHRPAHHATKHGTPPKKGRHKQHAKHAKHGHGAKVSPEKQIGINNRLAVQEIYGKEKSPYRAIPPDRQGPGQLTGGYHVLLQAWTVNLSVTATLGADGAKLTGGLGNWSSIAVPRGQALTQWTGQSLLTMDLALMIDGWHHQRSVEPQIAALTKLATRQPGMLTPPSLRIIGATPAPRTRWVITGLDWGDALRSFRSGARLRQEVTVHLLQYRDETDLQALPRAAAAAKPPRKYKVKKGDDLKKLATRFYHKASKWPVIEKANKGMRGWKLGHKWVGKTIKIPPADDTKKKHKPTHHTDKQHAGTRGKAPQSN